MPEPIEQEIENDPAEIHYELTDDDIAEIEANVGAELEEEDMATKHKKNKPKEEQVVVAEEVKVLKPKKKDLDVKTQKTIFGHIIPTSTIEEWSYKNPLGWHHRSEDHLLKSYYAKCELSGLWTDKAKMGKTIDGLFVSKAEAEKAGLGECCFSNVWMRREALDLEVRIGENAEMKRASSVKARDMGISFQKCGLSGELFYGHTMIKIHTNNPLYANPIAYHTLLAHKDLFDICNVCSRYHENCDLEKVNNYCKCKPCVDTELIGKYLHAYNAATHPPAIYSPLTELGAEKIFGLYSSTGNKLKIKPRLLGWEAETEFSYDEMVAQGRMRGKVAELTQAAFGKGYVSLKEDGSLLLNGKYSGKKGPNGCLGNQYAGFEIVSCPCNMPTHRKKLMELDVKRQEDEGLVKLWKLYLAWDTTYCGFHVHVDRTWLTTMQISRMGRFINHKANRRFMYRIVGRSSNKYCVYLEKKLTDIISPETFYISPNETDPHHKARRVALNLHKPETVEFRIFRGTMNPKHMLRYLEFCDAVCDFCYPGSRSFVEIDNYKYFIKFVWQNAKRWPILASWLYQAGEHVPKRKFGEKAKMDDVTIQVGNIEEFDHKEEIEQDQEKPECVPLPPSAHEAGAGITITSTGVVAGNSMPPASANPPPAALDPFGEDFPLIYKEKQFKFGGIDIIHQSTKPANLKTITDQELASACVAAAQGLI